MRLLLCIPYFAPAYAFGGSVTLSETVVRGALAAGHEVTVATTDVLDETSRTGAGTPGIPGASVHRFPNVSHRAAASMNLYLPRGYRKWLRANVGRHDVVLLEDVYSAVSVGGARAAERSGVPYALQPLGTLSPAPERGRALAKRTFLRLWGDHTLARASALICATEHERGEFLDAGGDERLLRRLPPPLDLPDMRPLEKRSPARIAFVGRLHPIKRLDLLIQALASARRSVPDLELDIVGPGDAHRHELEALAGRLGVRDAVTFHGFVSAEEKLRILGEAELGALLSDGEGLPMSALETMACGTPMVLSPGCHIPEADERAGVVVTGGPDAVAEAVVELLRDRERRERLARGARAFAREFRADEVMPLMLELLVGLTERKPT